MAKTKSPSARSRANLSSKYRCLTLGLLLAQWPMFETVIYNTILLRPLDPKAPMHLPSNPEAQLAIRHDRVLDSLVAGDLRELDALVAGDCLIVAQQGARVDRQTWIDSHHTE